MAAAASTPLPGLTKEHINVTTISIKDNGTVASRSTDMYALDFDPARFVNAILNDRGYGAGHLDISMPGGAKAAKDDFNSMVIPGSVVDKNGRLVGKNINGDTVVYYPESRSTKGPTISVQDPDGNPQYKFRY
jgi:hypothetical protein